MSLNDLWIEFLGNQNGEFDAPTVTHTADNIVTNASEVILAANTARKGMIIQNTDALNNVRVNLAGTDATTTNGIQIKPGQALTLTRPNCPTGAIKAIREGATDAVVHVVELT